jgi:hypothetical protein
MILSPEGGKPIQALPTQQVPSPARPESRMPLSFLVRLQHEEFPVRVVEPEEIRHVSVLSATGLIDANIPALHPTVRYASPRLVTVTRITEEGRAWLMALGEAPKPATATMKLGRGLPFM